MFLQVKELGAVLYNCSCFAEDMQKIFDVYWFMGKPDQTLPHSWPKQYSTSFNHLTPLQVQLNNTRAAVYLAVCSHFMFFCLLNLFSSQPLIYRIPSTLSDFLSFILIILLSTISGVRMNCLTLSLWFGSIKFCIDLV